MQDQNQNQPNFELETQQDEIKNSIKSFIWETVKIIIVSLIIIVPIRYYVIQPFYVQGASMEPNFFDKEYLIIDELSYRLNEPQRGDVVVFKYPKSPKDFFIKRIIALPNEKITISNNQIKIYNTDYPNGFILDETEYLPPDTKTPNEIEATLSTNEYFVIGDNRVSSLDSRSFGSITLNDMIGKTWLRGWPISRFTIFENPEY
ncbi:signal peptidase I [Patescibacteria group bacterium]